MTPSTPIPVVLFGKTEDAGAAVAALLQPEYEVVHFITSFEEAQSVLPAILSGSAPASPPSSVGTGNYTNGVRAIILGPAFTTDQVEILRAASPASAPVAWVVGGAGGTAAGSVAEAAQNAVSAVKGALAGWVAAGGQQDGIINY